MDTIVINDKTIIAFYNDNPNLNIVDINLIFIDILKKLSTNLNETLTNTVNHKILSTLTELTKDIYNIKQDVSTKLNDTKKEYIENLKLILDNTNNNNYDKIQNMLDKNNETIVNKTTSIINEFMPKNNEKVSSIIENSIRTLHETINHDTNMLIDNINKDDKNINEFINNIDNRFNSMINSLQQPIFSFIQSSEERTNNNVQQIREKLVAQQLSQETLNNGMQEFLNKYKHNSSSKGNISETELYSILQNIFPCDENLCNGPSLPLCDPCLKQSKPRLSYALMLPKQG